MAVNGSNETVQTVLEINTQGSQKSIKQLRQDIKDLKDELLNLDTGTQEYIDTAAVLGDKMHQLSELNEQLRMTTADFGQTMSNITNVMAGGVAAVQGLTAGLSLLGVDMGDDNKLTQTLIKSMALLQSLSSMDKAIKSFKALSTVLKANIAAAGGLSKALKAVTVSNPFILIAAAAAAAAIAITKVVKHNKELAEQEKEVASQAREAAEAIRFMNLQLDEVNVTNKLAFNASGVQTEVDKVKQEILSLVGELNKPGQTAEEQAKHWGQVMTQQYDNAVKSGDKYRQMLLQIVQIQWELRGARADYLEGEKTQADYKKAEAEANKQVYKTYADYINSKKQNDKKEVDVEKQKYDLALKRLNLQKTLDETAITAQYEEDKRAAEGNVEELLAIEERYQAARLELNQKYYTDAIALAEKFKQTRKTETEQLDVDQTIANLNKSLQEATDSYADFTVEQEKSRKERELEIQTLQAEIAALDHETEVITRNSAMTTQFNQETLDTLKQKQEQYGLLLGASSTYYEQEREFLRSLMVLENEHNDLVEQQTGIDNQLKVLQSQYEQGLIAYEEYEKQKAELRKQYAEVQAELDENEVEQERTKLERKKELNEAYKSAISNITNQLVNLLNTMANADDVAFEDQKKMKIAAATISTIQGGIDAFMSYMNSGIPQPYNSILGAAAAAATVAMGMAEIQKIRNTKKDSAGNVSTTAMQTVMTPPQIVNLNQVNDEIELPDTRVYVLESDITSAQNRVRVTENNSTF